MKKLSRLATLVVAAGLVLALAAVASAATTAIYNAGVTPTGRAGTPTKPKPMTFTASATVTNGDGTQPPQVRTIALGLDKNIKFRGELFPKCTTAKIVAAKDINVASCRKAKVGSSEATAQVGTTVLIFDTTLYNGGKGKMVVAVQQRGGAIFSAFDAPIVGSTVNITLPDSLRQPIPGLYPSLTGLQKVRIGLAARVPRRVRVAGKLVTRTVLSGYIESIGCTAKSYKLNTTFKFVATPTNPTPGPDIVARATTKCSSAA